jgi:GT2 family glycosyltransferase
MTLTAPPLDVLVPTYRRPAALAATLAALAAQSLRDFRVIVSDQTDEGPPAIEAPEVRSVAGVLELTGRAVELHRHLPRRGMAEHREFLLTRVRAPYALFLDDDVICEGDLLERLLRAIRDAGCGFVGAGLIGPSFADDVRPEEHAPFEPWPGNRVRPEAVEPGSPAWERWQLHNAANLHHLRERREAETGDRPPDTLYKVAWVGGCVLYDTAKLRETGGFSFWRELPAEHAGEDVLAQLRLMRRHGGAGLFPSGAYHLELPTTIPDREVDAPLVIQA